MTPHDVPLSQTGSGVLVPDVDGVLVEPLRLLAGLLDDVRAWTWDQEGAHAIPRLPGVLADCGTLLSVRRLIYLLEPTQGCSEQVAGVYGPHDPEPHTVLTPVSLPAPDVNALNLAVRVLGHPFVPAPVRNLLSLHAGVQRPDQRTDDPSGVVAELAALAGLLDLPVTRGTRMLATRLLAARHRGAPAVLTENEETVYREVIARINVLWTAGNPDHRALR